LRSSGKHALSQRNLASCAACLAASEGPSTRACRAARRDDAAAPERASTCTDKQQRTRPASSGSSSATSPSATTTHNAAAQQGPALVALIGSIALGLALSIQIDATHELPLASWAAILFGLVLYSLGQTQLRRWGPRNRQDEQLGQAIRGLDDRYKLYAFLSTSVPDYILISPAGVHVLIVRQEAGQVTCMKDVWNKGSSSRLMAFFGPTLGNPSAEAARQLQKLRALLAEQGITWGKVTKRKTEGQGNEVKYETNSVWR